MGINLGISGSIISFNFHSTGATIASHHTHKETEAREAHVVVLGQGTNKLWSQDSTQVCFTLQTHFAVLPSESKELKETVTLILMLKFT